MILDRGCFERGCACYDYRVDKDGIEVVKKEWVGLTRQEAEDVVDDFITIGGDVENWVGYWQAIEAKLKEKNT